MNHGVRSCLININFRMDIIRKQYKLYKRESATGGNNSAQHEYRYGRFEEIENLGCDWSIVRFHPDNDQDLSILDNEELFTTENGDQLWRTPAHLQYKVKNFSFATEIKPCSSIDTQMARMNQMIQDIPNETQFWQNRGVTEQPIPGKRVNHVIENNNILPDVTLYEITSVHGCPGSGKSTLIVNLIKKIHKNYKCLVVSPSHNVVENFAGKIAKLVPRPKFSILSEESKISANLTRFHNSNHPDYDPRNKNALLSDIDVTLSTVNKNIKGVRKAIIEVLIVDEATRVPIIDFFALIQKMTTLKAVILAGDPRQMGARIGDHEVENILQFASKMNLGPVWQLYNQYRFGADTNSMISKTFYNGKMIAVRKKRESSIGFVKLSKCNCQHDSNLGCSYEARQVLKMVKIVRNYGDDKHILVVTPYKSQIARLKAILPEKNITLKTLDTIQGDEYDNVIISLGRHKRAGFLNKKRINVALTRARYLTIVIGHSKAITDCQPLNQIEILANKAEFVVTI